MSPRVLLVVSLVVAGAGRLAAQRALEWELAASGVGMRLNSVPGAGSATQRLTGAVFGLQGQLVFARRITFDIGYWQGQLQPSSTQTAERDVVEGYSLLGAKPFGWLSLRAGPHAWTYISDAGTQRWLLWEARASLLGEISGDVHSYLELWDVLSATVNVQQEFQKGFGGEGGLVLLLRDAPIFPERFAVRIKLGYGIERVRMGIAERSEVLDRLTLSLGIGQH